MHYPTLWLIAEVLIPSSWRTKATFSRPEVDAQFAITLGQIGVSRRLPKILNCATRLGVSSSTAMVEFLLLSSAEVDHAPPYWRRTMPEPRKVISISERTSAPYHSQEITDLAYAHWLARHFKNGSPEEDWLRAIYEISVRRTPLAGPRLFLVRTPLVRTPLGRTPLVRTPLVRTPRGLFRGAGRPS
ncbi:MAG: hypothetical protein JWP63_3742 [Candidatus Solibacter sp.]|nr:hypothetical protein [Candidatus Solibacter sp.]